MSGESSLWDLYWQPPQPEVNETESHRCDTCSRISFASFRTDTALAEILEPRTFVMGSLKNVMHSAYAGCYVCRLITREFLQYAKSILPLSSFYNTITKIGLRLSLDDELTLHYCGHSEEWTLLKAIDLRDSTEDYDIASLNKNNRRQELVWHILEGGHKLLADEGW